MSEKEKKELLENITKLSPEHKAFVTGYAAGVAAKADECEKAENDAPPGTPPAQR